MYLLAIIGFLLPSAMIPLFAEWRARRIRAEARRHTTVHPWQRCGSLFTLLD